MAELMRYLGYSNDVKTFFLTVIGWSFLFTGFIISTILLIEVLRKIFSIIFGVSCFKHHF